MSDMCSICLEDLDLENSAVLRNCHHVYHHDCIIQAIDCRGKCPACRGDANRSDVLRLRMHEPVPGYLMQTITIEERSRISDFVKDLSKGHFNYQAFRHLLEVLGTAALIVVVGHVCMWYWPVILSALSVSNLGRAFVTILKSAMCLMKEHVGIVVLAAYGFFSYKLITFSCEQEQQEESNV